MCGGRWMGWGSRGGVNLRWHVKVTAKARISLLHMIVLLSGSEESTVSWVRDGVRHVLLHFHVALSG